jgi:hypothetical protein
VDEELVCRMEEVLDLYTEPENPQEPVVCVDERPYQLLACPSGGPAAGGLHLPTAGGLSSVGYPLLPTVLASNGPKLISPGC